MEGRWAPSLPMTATVRQTTKKYLIDLKLILWQSPASWVSLPLFPESWYKTLEEMHQWWTIENCSEFKFCKIPFWERTIGLAEGLAVRHKTSPRWHWDFLLHSQVQLQVSSGLVLIFLWLSPFQWVTGVSSIDWIPCRSLRSSPCRWSWYWPVHSFVFSSLPDCCSKIWCNETIAEFAGGPRPVNRRLWLILDYMTDKIRSELYLMILSSFSLSINEDRKSTEWIK